MGLMDLLQDALQGQNPGAHFDHVAAQAPKDDLAHGVAEALRSDATPPFGETVARLFGQSDPQQRAGILNRILDAIGPGAAGALGGGLLGRVLTPGSDRITPEQASQLSPEQVKDIADHAERQDPGIVDRAAYFYAEHSGLIKLLGGAALAVTLAKVKNRVEQRH